MLYFIENNYTRRLYKQISGQTSEFDLIAKNELDLVSESDILIVDQYDLDCIAGQNISKDQIIVLGEPHEAYKSISKFQSYRQIKAQINCSQFPTYVFTSDQNINLTDIFLYKLADILKVDYIVSLNFSSKSNFSLYQWVINQSLEVPKNIILDLISTVPDMLNTPETDVLTFINKLALKGSVLIISYPLKGNLDKQLLSIANTVFWVTIPAEINNLDHMYQYVKGEIHQIHIDSIENKNQISRETNFIEHRILNNIVKIKGV